MTRFASTRSEKRDRHPEALRAQCSVGSIEDEGILYGFTTHALIATTIAIAPTIVTTQSMTVRHGCGTPMRSSGFLTSAFSPGSARAATRRCACDRPSAALRERANLGTPRA